MTTGLPVAAQEPVVFSASPLQGVSSEGQGACHLFLANPQGQFLTTCNPTTVLSATGGAGVVLEPPAAPAPAPGWQLPSLLSNSGQVARVQACQNPSSLEWDVCLHRWDKQGQIQDQVVAVAAKSADQMWVAPHAMSADGSVLFTVTSGNAGLNVNAAMLWRADGSVNKVPEPANAGFRPLTMSDTAVIMGTLHPKPAPPSPPSPPSPPTSPAAMAADGDASRPCQGSPVGIAFATWSADSGFATLPVPDKDECTGTVNLSANGRFAAANFYAPYEFDGPGRIARFDLLSGQWTNIDIAPRPGMVQPKHVADDGRLLVEYRDTFWENPDTLFVNDTSAVRLTSRTVSGLREWESYVHAQTICADGSLLGDDVTTTAKIRSQPRLFKPVTHGG